MKTALIQLGLFILMIATNFFAATGQLGTASTGDISDRFPLLITPPGYVFSIWSIIYTGLLLFVITSLTKQGRSIHKKVFPWVLANFSCNMLWLVSWHFEYYYISLVVMLMILGTLIQIYRKGNIFSRSANWKEQISFDVPFSLYTGWISIATLVNFTHTVNLLTPIGQNVIWTSMILLIAGAVCLFAIWYLHNPIIPLVYFWALTGLLQGFQDTQQALFMITALVLGGNAIFYAIERFFHFKHSRK
jgi:benzodiazapine receptor